MRKGIVCLAFNFIFGEPITAMFTTAAPVAFLDAGGRCPPYKRLFTFHASGFTMFLFSRKNGVSKQFY
jgi:hypothetical protein